VSPPLASQALQASDFVMTTKQQQLSLPPMAGFGLPTSLFDSPPLVRRRNPLRKRASTGERCALLAALAAENNQQHRRTRKLVHYKIFIQNAVLAELQENVIANMHHGDEIDRHYNSVHVTVRGVLGNSALSVIALDVDVPCGIEIEQKNSNTANKNKSGSGNSKNTGSDVYLHYLREIKKAKLDIAKTVVESSCSTSRAGFQSSN
jgi:hypothetical protein